MRVTFGPEKRVFEKLRHRAGSSPKGETNSGCRGDPYGDQVAQMASGPISTRQPGTYQVIVGKLPGTEVPPLECHQVQGSLRLYLAALATQDASKLEATAGWSSN